MTPSPGFSTPPHIPNNSTSERPPVITTMFAATTPENTPFSYHASTSANPNPIISPAFVEANYEVLESLLRQRRRHICNKDLQTELEYFSEDNDEEREMEPRPEPNKEVTPTLRLRSPVVLRQRERVVGFEEAPNREGSKRGRNAKAIRPSEIEAREDENRGVSHQPSTNMGGNLPPNSTLLSHHSQPFIPSSLHTPTGLVAIHVNPYSQPSAGLVNGQTLNFPFQTQIGNPPARGISPIIQKEGIYHKLSPIMAYLHTMGQCSFADSTGFVTPFVRWIEDYPLPDGLKMPFQISSYDGKGDPDNFLHLFKGVIRMQKWLMFVACHMFTYTLKDFTRIWWNSHKTGLHEEQRISGFVHGLRTRSLFEHLFTDLPSTYKVLMEKTYTWIEAREVATNGTPNDRRENFKRSRKSSWDNNRGQKGRDRFSPYRGPNHGLLFNLSKSPREILATEKAARSFEQPPRMFRSRRSRNMSKYCHFHNDHGHDTNDCYQLRNQIEEDVKSRQLSHHVKGIKKERVKASENQRTEEKKDKSIMPAEAPIFMIRQDESYTKNKFEGITFEGKEITFPSGGSNSSAPVVIKSKIFRREVNRVHMDRGSSCEVIYEHRFMKLKSSIRASKVYSKVPLIRFLGEKSWSVGKIPLEITIGDAPLTRKETLNFVIVKSDSPYNMLLGRTAMQKMGIVVSTIHGAIKFHTTKRIGTVFSTHESDKVKEGMKKYPEQTITIGKQLPEHFKGRLRDLLRANVDVFAWTHDDMTGIPRTITVKGNPFNTERKLNEYSHVKPIKQKRRGLGPDRSTAACKEVEELMKAGGYNQIQMEEGDEDKTAFFTREGVFYYRKMPFGLKNVGATYQRLVDKVFHNQIGRNLEAYVDDMVIK
ncbi:hypothetical protein Tco_0079845, partial [Tanacetum coccineum]